MIFAVAIAGYTSSRFIPHAPPAAPDLVVSWAMITETKKLLRMAMAKRSVMLSIMGISWFWLIGSGFLAQFPGLTERVLLGDTTVVTLILCVFTLSIAIGSLLCEKLSGHQIEIGLVPLGAFGMSLAGLHMYFSIVNVEHWAAANAVAHRGWLEFLAAHGSVRLLFDFGLIGMFGGMFIVPLYAFIQANTEASKRARIIAVNNVLNAVFMVVGSLFAIFLLKAADVGIPNLLLTLILMNFAVTTFIFKQVPEFLMRFIVWALGHSLYQVTHEDLHEIPKAGGALLVCNHVSYVDALLLAGAVRRPIRFIMFKPIFDLPVLNFVFRTGGAIPINKRSEDPAAYEEAFRQIDAALTQGDLLCIFPEGRLTSDGEIGEFQAGVEKIVATTPVPVIHMALRGLWGSWCSPQDGVFSGRMRPFSRVDVVAGKPVPAAMVNAADLQARVTQLRGVFA
jgi:1-acyl-sn-glycerol-3-phosphate acyltransferase